VNIPFANVVFTESVGNQVLLVPEDWEASFTGLTQEGAVLRAVVGELVIKQTVAGAATNTFMWGIYMGGPSGAVPTFTTSGMSEVIWLRTGARGCSTTVTDSLAANSYQNVQPILLKVKRRITTRDQISICAQFGADVGSPSAVLGGLLRFLVARD
jgi:hypothetical protein